MAAKPRFLCSAGFGDQRRGSFFCAQKQRRDRCPALSWNHRCSSLHYWATWSATSGIRTRHNSQQRHLQASTPTACYQWTSFFVACIQIRMASWSPAFDQHWVLNLVITPWISRIHLCDHDWWFRYDPACWCTASHHSFCWPWCHLLYSVPFILNGYGHCSRCSSPLCSAALYSDWSSSAHLSTYDTSIGSILRYFKALWQPCPHHHRKMSLL